MNLLKRCSRYLGLVVVLLALFGCGLLKKKKPEPQVIAPTPAVTATVPPAAPATTVAPAPDPAAAAVPDDAIPAPEDFEDEAFSKVSDKSYKTELDSIKKELDQPATP